MHKITRNFPKIYEDYPNNFRRLPKISENHSKSSEDFRKLPKLRIADNWRRSSNFIRRIANIIGNLQKIPCRSPPSSVIFSCILLCNHTVFLVQIFLRVTGDFFDMTDVPILMWDRSQHYHCQVPPTSQRHGSERGLSPWKQHQGFAKGTKKLNSNGVMQSKLSLRTIHLVLKRPTFMYTNMHYHKLVNRFGCVEKQMNCYVAHSSENLGKKLSFTDQQQASRHA